MSSWRALAAEALADPRPCAEIAIIAKMLPDRGLEANSGNFDNSGARIGARSDIAAPPPEAAEAPIEWTRGLAAFAQEPPPRGVEAKAWVAMLDAAGRFLKQWGGKAAALGWTASQLFSLDRNAPMHRLDRRGAAFFLAGAEIVAISEDEIAIRMGGALQRIRRRPHSGAPAWEREAP